MNELQQLLYDTSRVLLWPALVAIVLCLIWTAIEFGIFLYELWLRFRFRSLDALEGRALRARRAFAEGKPRTAYRALQENRYSIVITRFLFGLIRNYQTERLEAKPLKLLQESEFTTLKRLERTRILVRLGPVLGLMGTLILLSPALIGLSQGNAGQFITSLTTAFSLTVIGLLVGVVAFAISIVRDRMYAQDLSDMEYLMELLEGSSGRLSAGRRRTKKGIWEADPPLTPKQEEAPETQETPAKQTTEPASTTPQSEPSAAAPQAEATVVLPAQTEAQAEAADAAPAQAENAKAEAQVAELEPQAPASEPSAAAPQAEATVVLPAQAEAADAAPAQAEPPTNLEEELPSQTEPPSQRPRVELSPQTPEVEAEAPPQTQSAPTPIQPVSHRTSSEVFGDIDEPDALGPDSPSSLPATPSLSWPEASQPGDTRGFLSLDEPTLIWPADEDPFADLGPVDTTPRAT